MTDGTARDRRLPYALADGYVRPQERTLAEKLALTASIAEHVRFSGSEGSWARLFEQEPAVIMAELLAVRPDIRRSDFLSLLETDALAAAIELKALARRVEVWLTRASSARGDHFSAQLQAIDSFGAVSVLIRTIDVADAGPGALAAALRKSKAADDTPRDAIADARVARQSLVDAYETLLNVVTALTPAVERLFDARLTSGQIDPALGLLLTELKLLGAFEDRINRFDRRHRDYYYGEVLGQAPRPAIPEGVLLRFAPGQRPITVEAGAELVARSGLPGQQRYRLTEGLRVAPVRVADARVLRFHRDPLISPQSEMGFVTGVGLASLCADGAADWQRLFAAPPRTDAAMGLVIASPMLVLGEGRRRIEVRLRMGRRQEAAPSDSIRTDRDMLAAGDTGSDPASDAVASAMLSDWAAFAPFGLGPPETALPVVSGWVADLAADAGQPVTPGLVLHALLRHASSPAQVQVIYGRVVATALIEAAPWPAGAFRALLLQRIGTHLGGAAAAAVAAGLLDRPRGDVFQQLLHDAFEFSLSTEVGPFPVETAGVAPNPAGGPAGIAFRLQLDEAAPAVVPPPGARSPELTIRMASLARFCPLSLFEPFVLEAVEIDVLVRGLRGLTAFSDDGPLDVARPFMPFGARPRDGATFLVGARELALKPVSQVGVHLSWTDLPRRAGGFAEHYRDYGLTFPSPEPRLALSYLTSEGWKPLGEEPVPMVRRSAPDGPLLPLWGFETPIPGRPLVPGRAAAQADFRQRHAIRAGLIRMELDCPGEAFGHAAYPGALANAMRPSLRPGARQRPIPPAPYTPQVAGISLDYGARATIVLDAPQAARPGEAITQIGPFGSQEIYPARERPDAGLFPPRLADGTLFVRIQGPDATGPVSLLFEMESGSHQRIAFQPEAIAWHYLTTAGWRPLPSWSLISDSTDGLMRSGIVTIDVPDGDVALDSGLMPGAGVWLAASADRHLHAFPRLASLTTNGARAERLDPGQGDAGVAGQALALDPPRPGLGAIAQVGAALGGAPPETEGAFAARVAERLRHRQRAVTGWDIERLVLDAFPQVQKAKCFPALGPDGSRMPGAITVAVVPSAPKEAGLIPGQAAMFDVLTLRRIEAFLAKRTSPFATILVRNPSYERLQVRAKVGFASLSDSGTLLQRLKLDISRFVAVWTATPPMDGFGWSLNLNDVSAFVAGLDYTQFTTDLSILHLVADDGGSYRLYDTARAGTATQVLGFREPWSLPLPMADHQITVVNEPASEQPRAAGIGVLGIGETLVVDRTEGA